MTSVLVIDDYEPIRGILRTGLEDEGYAVLEAGDGRSAIKTCESKSVDVAIVDFDMPEKDGIETILDLKRDHGEIKIIAMSGNAQNGNVNFLNIARTFGAEYTFTKPFKLKEIVHAVNMLDPQA